MCGSERVERLEGFDKLLALAEFVLQGEGYHDLAAIRFSIQTAKQLMHSTDSFECTVCGDASHYPVNQTDGQMLVHQGYSTQNITNPNGGSID
jgi:hypothetical protein